jgi:hypothetical protein
MKISDGAVLARLKDVLDGKSADPNLVEAVQKYFKGKS